MMMTTRCKSSTNTFLSTVFLLWSSGILTTTTTTTTHAQLTIGIPGLFEVNVSVPGLTDGENATATTIDLEQTLQDVAEFIGGALDNFTLPDELQDVFDMPNFDNFSFSFGGNCSFCDEVGQMDGDTMLEGIKCSNWAAVAAIGIPADSFQCDLVRVSAAQFCGCPIPPASQGKTCSVCPQGQSPSVWMAAGTNETLAVTCDDLVDAPAVDGDRTCQTISRITELCDCQDNGDNNNNNNKNNNNNGGDAAESTTSSILSGAVASTVGSQLLLVMLLALAGLYM